MGERIETEFDMTEKRYTKEQLTKASIYNSMIERVRTFVVFGTVTYLFLAAMIFLGCVICYFMTFEIPKNETERRVMACVLVVFLGLATAFVLAALIYSRTRGHMSTYYYEDFSVEEGVLCDIREELQGWGRNRRLYRIFDFAKAGKYYVRQDEIGMYQYSSIGDSFYIVIVRGKINCVYNKKIYNYTGELV